jgi:SH3 domain-containing YSC84-like protein 1
LRQAGLFAWDDQGVVVSGTKGQAAFVYGFILPMRGLAAGVIALAGQTIHQKGAFMKKVVLFVMLAACALPLLAEDKKKEEMKDTERIQAAATVMKEILGMPEGIPKDLLNKAECIVIYPSVKKAAFIVGGSYGRGVITCRRGQDFSGAWSAPAMFALEGGSFGFQIGAQETDFVLLVMNESGAKSVLSSKVKLGADASAAAGPKGRDTSAETDVVMKAEILSYSRAQGLFAGVSLEGSTMRSDDGANKALYGKELSAKEIVREGKVKAPASAARLLAILTKASPKHVRK